MRQQGYPRPAAFAKICRLDYYWLMGRKGDETKARMIAATRDLLECGGYSAAGLNQIIAASGAPRGSLYFHFPGGKDQLITESARQAGQFIEFVIAGVEAENVDSYI